MSARRRVGIRVALVVFVAALVGAALAGAGAGSTGPASSALAGLDADGTVLSTERATAEGSPVAQEVDADRTRIRIDLRPDGDAVWTVELWTALQDDADRAAFQSLQEDVAANESAFATDFRDRMSGSVQAASDETGRNMAIRNVSVSTRTEAVPSEYGVLVYEFEWTNFAAVDGQKLRAGDAIDGFLLTENTRLTISWPEGYRQASITPSPDDRTDQAVVWRGGETDFSIGEPRLLVTSAKRERSLLPLLGAGAVIVLVAAIVVWLGYTGRLPVPGRGDAAGAGGGGEPAGDAGAAGATGGADRSGVASEASEAGATDAAAKDGSQAGAAGSDAAPDAAAAGADASGGEDATQDVPPELLSNEEQVLQLLEEHGGRMKQQQVVAELDWTEAKTSQVVTSMDDADQIEKFRIGRENVLALPEEADL